MTAAAAEVFPEPAVESVTPAPISASGEPRSPRQPHIISLHLHDRFDDIPHFHDLPPGLQAHLREYFHDFVSDPRAVQQAVEACLNEQQ